MLKKLPYSDLNGIEQNFQTLYGEITDFQKNRYNALFERFKSEFGYNEGYIASSSGRVEVCGNHTDHNGGKVVSCAISLDTLAVFMPTDDNVITIKSEGYPEIKVDINGEATEKIGTSPALVRGVAVGVKNFGYKVGGFSACFTSNVIGGAGISSSASFEVLVAEILNFLYNDGAIDNENKSKIAQFSENVYFGKPCGLLDQTAIAFGGLKLLDFKDKSSIKVKNIENNLKDYTIILINTGGSHAGLTDEYAAIPNEMFSVASAMGKERLIDVGKKEFYNKLPDFYSKLADRAVLRAIHFFEENDRVDSLYNALQNEDYETFLNMINQSGKSSLYKLQNCFVAGRSEQPIPKALALCESFLSGGANRVHGGGFAGSILNIVKNDDKEYFIEQASKYFSADSIIPLKVRSVGTIIL